MDDSQALKHRPVHVAAAVLLAVVIAGGCATPPADQAPAPTPAKPAQAPPPSPPPPTPPVPVEPAKPAPVPLNKPQAEKLTKEAIDLLQKGEEAAARTTLEQA